MNRFHRFPLTRLRILRAKELLIPFSTAAFLLFLFFFPLTKSLLQRQRLAEGLRDGAFSKSRKRFNCSRSDKKPSSRFTCVLCLPVRMRERSSNVSSPSDDVRLHFLSLNKTHFIFSLSQLLQGLMGPPGRDGLAGPRGEPVSHFPSFFFFSAVWLGKVIRRSKVALG